jgi:hypothetical protein
MDTALCLVGNNKIKSFFSLVIDSAKNKDYFKIFQITLSNFKELKLIFLNCVNKQPILKAEGSGWKEVAACRISCGKDKECLINCLKALSGKEDKEVQQEVSLDS